MQFSHGDATRPSDWRTAWPKRAECKRANEYDDEVSDCEPDVPDTDEDVLIKKEDKSEKTPSEANMIPPPAKRQRNRLRTDRRETSTGALAETSKSKAKITLSADALKQMTKAMRDSLRLTRVLEGCRRSVLGKHGCRRAQVIHRIALRKVQEHTDMWRCRSRASFRSPLRQIFEAAQG